MDATYMTCSQSTDDVIPQKWTSLKKSWLQGGGFILICLLTFGISFCDNPGSLQDKFQSAMNMTSSKFVLLTTIYSWPNVILSFVGGFLVDSLFGIRWGTIIYLILTLFGQLLFAMGTFANIFWIMLLGRFIFGKLNVAWFNTVCCFLSNGASKTGPGKQVKSIKLVDIKDFKLAFWLIVLICSAFDVAVTPFAVLSKSYFMKKYHFEADAANKLLSLVYTISAVTAPLFGILIDKTGGNISWVVASIIGLSYAHRLIAFTYTNPYACMAIFGLSCSLFVTSIWPMIAHVVPEHQLGTAYEINQAILNLTSAVTTMYCGVIVDYYSYTILELFFLAWLLMALVIAFIIWISEPTSTNKR